MLRVYGFSVLGFKDSGFRDCRVEGSNGSCHSGLTNNWEYNGKQWDDAMETEVMKGYIGLSWWNGQSN